MRQALSVQFNRHGGRIDDAKCAFPNAPQPWLDLSTGINPHAWEPSQPIQVDHACLPDTTALAALEQEAARYFGIDPARVVAVPGSELCLRLLGVLGLPRTVALSPTYGTHLDVAADQIPFTAWESVIGTACTILIANPNNPDGRMLDTEELAKVGTRQALADGFLVIDEAFVDPSPGHSLVPRLTGAEPIMVLRSFGKFFGLAGLRLGFAIAPPAIVARLRAFLGDWPVSAHAIAWGRAAYADAQWTANMRSQLPEAAANLDLVLRRHGLHATGTSPLFRLVQHQEAGRLFEQLARAGILTRPFSARTDWLRFGLPGSRSALDRLDLALSLE